MRCSGNGSHSDHRTWIRELAEIAIAPHSEIRALAPAETEEARAWPGGFDR